MKRVMAALLALAPVAAGAQIGSESYQFLEAVRKGDGPAANKFMSASGTTVIDTRDQTTGQGAMHIVVARRDLGWMSLLISRGARLDLRDKQGRTPLMIAAELGFREGAELLLSRRAGVDIANNSGETPLIRAVQRRDLAMVRLLLEKGANPDEADTLAGLSARDYAKNDARNAAIARLIEDAPVKAKATYGP